MKKTIPTLLILGILLLGVQCSKNNYVIAKGKVGKITKKTTEKDLKKLFESDSIVENTEKTVLSKDEKRYQVFSNGKKELEITFSKKDSLFSISNVQLFSDKYKTEKGISIKSTFNDIRKNYTINSAEATFSSVVLFINELNATISIDKSQTGITNFTTQKIKLEQIPDAVKAKYFTIWFY